MPAAVSDCSWMIRTVKLIARFAYVKYLKIRQGNNNDRTYFPDMSYKVQRQSENSYQSQFILTKDTELVLIVSVMR